jgi:hypothetical protein
MWALIEGDLAERGVAVDRSGMTGTVCETYPRAALNAWGWAKKGKLTLEDLCRLFPFSEGLKTSRDPSPVLTSAMRWCAKWWLERASRGRTLCPPELDADLAREEGWIHATLDQPHQLGFDLANGAASDTCASESSIWSAGFAP